MLNDDEADAGIRPIDAIGPYLRPPRGTACHFDPELPWGCWLRIESTAGGETYVDDAKGESFPDLRAALWHGRLRMPPSDPDTREGMLATVRAVLAAVAGEWSEGGVAKAVPSEASQITRRWFIPWLASAGLIEPGEGARGSWTLTGEGESVLNMLATMDRNRTGPADRSGSDAA